jgi:single-strand selective monofunctional uracil DNA glycosylase
VSLVAVTRELSERVSALSFGAPVEYVYNPLQYAREPHEKYLKKYGAGRKRALLVGMNPGPFGMAQTGVPFGDVALVRDFLGIEGAVSAPSHQHPKRLVQGFSCARSEVSGTRLWGWAKTRFGTAGAFFEHFFVYNYCPLAFMEASSRNRTPDKLPKQEREPLYAACDAALVQVAKSLAPEWVIGIGAFAEKRARQALESAQVSFGSILHPSPASPQANRGWGRLADEQLARYGL